MRKIFVRHLPLLLLLHFTNHIKSLENKDRQQFVFFLQLVYYPLYYYIIRSLI